MKSLKQILVEAIREDGDPNDWNINGHDAKAPLTPKQREHLKYILDYEAYGSKSADVNYEPGDNRRWKQIIKFIEQPSTSAFDFVTHPLFDKLGLFDVVPEFEGNPFSVGGYTFTKDMTDTAEFITNVLNKRDVHLRRGIIKQREPEPSLWSKMGSKLNPWSK